MSCPLEQTELTRTGHEGFQTGGKGSAHLLRSGLSKGGASQLPLAPLPADTTLLLCPAEMLHREIAHTFHRISLKTCVDPLIWHLESLYFCCYWQDFTCLWALEHPCVSWKVQAGGERGGVCGCIRRSTPAKNVSPAAVLCFCFTRATPVTQTFPSRLFLQSPTAAAGLPGSLFLISGPGPPP